MYPAPKGGLPHARSRNGRRARGPARVPRMERCIRPGRQRPGGGEHARTLQDGELLLIEGSAAERFGVVAPGASRVFHLLPTAGEPPTRIWDRAIPSAWWPRLPAGETPHTSRPSRTGTPSGCRATHYSAWLGASGCRRGLLQDLAGRRRGLHVHGADALTGCACPISELSLPALARGGEHHRGGSRVDSACGRRNSPRHWGLFPNHSPERSRGCATRESSRCAARPSSSTTSVHWRGSAAAIRGLGASRNSLSVDYSAASERPGAARRKPSRGPGPR